MDKITTHDGLLWRNDTAVELPEADMVAREHGFNCAEEMVREMTIKRGNMNEMQLVPYGLDTVIVESLKAKYLDITIKPDDKAAYAMVMAGQRECREIRLSCESWHKDKKAWIVKAGRHYDDERRRVLGLLAPIEDHLKAVRQAEDDRKKAIEAEKARKEAERIQGIRSRIEAIRNTPLSVMGKPSHEIRAVLQRVLDTELTAEVFQEFLAEAQSVQEEIVSDLVIAADAASKREREDAERKAEAERLEAIRKQQAEESARLETLRKAEEDKVRKDREALEAERRKIEAEKAAIEAQKKAEADRVAREAWEKKTAEEARAKAEKDAAEKVEREAREAKEREEKEKVEKARAEALKPDRERLLDWASRIEIVNSPILSTEAGIEIFNATLNKLCKVVDGLRKAVKELK